MDRLNSMRVFVKAVEMGSFSAASDELNMSPQLVGKNVQFLEDQLGARLLNRTTRRQSLTEIGEIFYERVKIILSEVQRADSLIAETQAEPRGRLRINAPMTFGISALTPKLAEYMRQYPEISVDLTLSNQIVDVVDDAYDAVFRVGILSASALISKELAPYRLVACASPAYLDRKGTPLHPNDLLTHECLGFSHTSLRYHWEFESHEGPIVVPVSGRLMVNSGEALLAAALQGMGIIMQPVELVSAAINTGQLRPILRDYLIPSRPLHVLYSADRYMTPKLRSFLDYSLKMFGVQEAESNQSNFSLRR